MLRLAFPYLLISVCFLCYKTLCHDCFHTVIICKYVTRFASVLEKEDDRCARNSFDSITEICGLLSYSFLCKGSLFSD
jgi:hypothetical protein